jgi:RNA polymerase sigma-70 factor (ECF subfamily)
MEQTSLTDEEIVALIQQGDVDKFGEIILRYDEKLTRYARRFLSRQEDIVDLVQDTFIKAYTHIQSFDTTLRFSPWIYRIAHNVFVNELRRKEKFTSSWFDPDTILPFLPASERADTETLSADLMQEIDTLLAQLSPKYREVIVLHFLESMSYQEISDVLRVSVTTVGVRIMRAKAQLKKLFNEQNHIYA